MGDLSHAAAEPVADQGAFVYNRFALEVLVAREGERLPDTVNRVHGLLLMLKSLMGCSDNGLGLMSKVGCQLSMGGHYFSWRMDLFMVARRVCGDLGGLFSRSAGAFEVLTNLLTARTGCIEVFLRVSLDFRCAAPPGRNFVTELA